MTGDVYYASTNSSTCDNTWTYWTSGTTAGTCNVTWNTWNEPVGVPTIWQQPVLTEEQIAEQQQCSAELNRVLEEANEQYRQEQLRVEERRNAADAKAKELLQSFLTPEQLKSLEEQSNFIVESESKRLYKLRKMNNNGVLEIDQEGKRIGGLCANFGGADIPTYDLMLAQKLMIETNEELFLRTARRF